VAHMMGCPICGGPLSLTLAFDRPPVVDCPSRHHATTDPGTWQEAHALAVVQSVVDFHAAKAQDACLEHSWRPQERTENLTIMECTHCRAWAVDASSRGRHPSTWRKDR
jgi:hypothetical protein